jgi:hypothetical protein
VSKFDKDRSSPSAVAVVFILPAVIFVSAQSQPSPSPQAQKRMVRAVDRTLREGLHAQLPPHLSTLLGISEEKECPVMQSLVRTAKLVQGFDVSMANRNDVVLFVVNETTNDQTLYLTSREGTLQKVVSVKEGVGLVRRITNEDRKAFEKEKQFWLDRLDPVGASK